MTTVATRRATIATRRATVATRRATGDPALAAGVWEVDRRQSTVVFAGRHLLGTISGQVRDVSGKLLVADDATGAVEIDLGLHSADFGSELWNDLVRRNDLLGATAHPAARYVSRSVRISGATVLVDGDLDLNGYGCDLPLSVRHEPLGWSTARFTTTAIIDRRAFGLRWDLAAVGSDRFIAREVRLEIGLLAERVS
jgi:polyisoprenoid-binding protein YceI